MRFTSFSTSYVPGTGLVPYAAPSTGAFGGRLPEGERQGCRSFSVGLGSPFRKPSPKAPARRVKAASGSPADSRRPGARTSRAIGVQICSRQICLWILSFGNAKESIAAAGPRTGIQSSFAIANHCFIKRPTASRTTFERWSVVTIKTFYNFEVSLFQISSYVARTAGNASII